jgi:hypothetical protein
MPAGPGIRARAIFRSVPISTATATPISSPGADNGVWYWLQSSTSYNHADAMARQWGNGSPGDIP